MKSARLFVIAAVFFLSGCAAYTGIDAGKPIPVGNNITVTSEIAWAKATYPGLDGTLWTADGVALDAMMFFTGIESGKPLIQVNGQDKTDVRKYKVGMVPDDVMELAASNLGKMSYHQIATSNLRPAPFGSVDGFRFDLTGSTQDGLKVKGMALGAQRNNKLDLLLFVAPDEYYFGRYADTVDKLFASVKTAK